MNTFKKSGPSPKNGLERVAVNAVSSGVEEFLVNARELNRPEAELSFPCPCSLTCK